MAYASKTCEKCGLITSSYKLLEVKNRTNNNYKTKYYCHGPNTNDCYEKVRPKTIGDRIRFIFGIPIAAIMFVVGIFKFIIRIPSYAINAFKHLISFIKKALNILFIPIKILLYPFILAYRHNKKIRNVMVYIFGIIVFIFMKILSVLKFVGVKAMDQDGDGRVDLNDFAIAKKKVKDFFDKLKKDNEPSKISGSRYENVPENENTIEEKIKKGNPNNQI